MDVLADLLVYSIGGFVLKRAIAYLQDRALLNKRNLEEEESETASSHNLNAHSGIGRGASPSPARSVSSGRAGPSLPERSPSQRSASPSPRLPGHGGARSGHHAHSGLTSSARLAGQPSPHPQASSQQYLKSSQPALSASAASQPPSSTCSGSPVSAPCCCQQSQATSSPVPSPSRGSWPWQHTLCCVQSGEAAAASGQPPSSSSMQPPCQASPSFPGQLTDYDSAGSQPNSQGVAPGHDSPAAQHAMLAPGAGAADPSEPPSSPAAPAPEPTRTAACSASPVTGSGPAAVELPAASPTPPPPAVSDAAKSDQGAGAPVPTAATADATARQGRVASPGINALLGRTAGQPFPRGPRTIRPHHRTPRMAPLCGGTTSEGPAEPGPSAGASPQAMAAPPRLATPDQPVQHGSAAGAPLHRAVIDLVSSDDEDPQEGQTAEGTPSGLGLPSQVPDSGLEATDAGQRCSQGPSQLPTTDAAARFTQTKPRLAWAPNPAQAGPGRVASRSPSPRAAFSQPSSRSSTSPASPSDSEPAVYTRPLRRPLRMPSPSTSKGSDSMPSSASPASPPPLLRSMLHASAGHTPLRPPGTSLLASSSSEPASASRAATTPSEQRLPACPLPYTPPRSASPPSQPLRQRAKSLWQGKAGRMGSARTSRQSSSPERTVSRRSPQAGQALASRRLYGSVPAFQRRQRARVLALSQSRAQSPSPSPARSPSPDRAEPLHMLAEQATSTDQGRLLKPQAQMPAPPDELEAQQDTADEERKVSAETDEGSTSDDALSTSEADEWKIDQDAVTELLERVEKDFPQALTEKARLIRSQQRLDMDALADKQASKPEIRPERQACSSPMRARSPDPPSAQPTQVGAALEQAAAPLPDTSARGSLGQPGPSAARAPLPVAASRSEGFHPPSSPQPLQHLLQFSSPARTASPVSSLSTPRQASPASPEDPQARFLSGLHSIRSPRPSIKRPHWGTAMGSFPSKRGAHAASLRPKCTAPSTSEARNSLLRDAVGNAPQARPELLAPPAELCQPEPPISPWSVNPGSEPGMVDDPQSSTRQPAPHSGSQGAPSSPHPDVRYMQEVYALAGSLQEVPSQAQLLPRTPAPYSLPVGPDEAPSAERSRTPHPYSSAEPQAPYSSQGRPSPARPPAGQPPHHPKAARFQQAWTRCRAPSMKPLRSMFRRTSAAPPGLAAPAPHPASNARTTPSARSPPGTPPAPAAAQDPPTPVAAPAPRRARTCGQRSSLAGLAAALARAPAPAPPAGSSAATMHCRVANLQALSALPAAFPTLAHTGTGGGTGAAAPLPGRFSSLAAFEAEDDFWRDVAVVHDLDSMMHSVDSRPQQPARRSRGPGQWRLL